MKQFAILLAAVAMVALGSSESFAQRYHHGYGNSIYRGGGNSAFSISIGNGFNGISYSRGYGGFGVPVGGFYAPVRPVYGLSPIYGGGFPYGGYGRGVNINAGRGYGGYYRGGYGRPGCRGGW